MPESKRITIMIDEDNFKKLRKVQSIRIKDSPNSVSFSRIINEVLRDGLKSKKYN